MKRSYILAGAIALVATAWILSGQIGPFAIAQDSAESAQREQTAAVQRAQVRVSRLDAEPMLNEILVNGRTQADRDVTIKAEIQGRISEVLVDRGAQVAKDDIIAQIAVQDRQVAVEQATALQEQRRIELRAAERLAARGFEGEIRLAEARAEYNEARAALDRARIDLEHTTIRAPFDGVLEDRMVDVGDFVNAGDDIALLLDLDPIRVAGQVNERAVGDIAAGALGHARMFGEREYAGVVSYISSSSDAATRTFRVELEIPNPDGRIPAGVTAELRIPLHQVMAHHVSPAILSLADDGTVGVKVVDSANRVQFIPVQILNAEADGVWLDGLDPSVIVIVVGHEFVAHGQEVDAIHIGGAGSAERQQDTAS